jgi:hypothetical protein
MSKTVAIFRERTRVLTNPLYFRGVCDDKGLKEAAVVEQRAHFAVPACWEGAIYSG